MFNFFRLFKASPSGLKDSALFDDKTFYKAFINDLIMCKEEKVIESPFVTTTRARMFIPVFKNLISNGVKIHIITRDPDEIQMPVLPRGIIESYEEIGIDVLLSSGNHHRKIAILD